MNMQQVQQQEKRLTRIHLYSKKQLAGLTLAAAVSVLLSAGDYLFHSSLSWASGPILIASMTIYLLVIATILLMDWHGFLTMNGSIKWGSMTNTWMIFLGCVFVVCNIFFLGYYLVRAYQKYLNYKRLEPLRWKRRQAEAEAGEGIMLPTEGTCRTCHRPLLMGAEYCTYCRESVKERPRICPECYTRALPDSIWCPSCGSQIDRRV
jgi:hypothetical protein